MLLTRRTDPQWAKPKKNLNYLIRVLVRPEKKFELIRVNVRPEKKFEFKRRQKFVT